MEFTFSPTIEKVEGIPEQFRPLYEEKEGKQVLKAADPTVKGAVEAIVGLNTALQKERKTKVNLDPLKAYGNSVEEIAAGVQAKLEELSSQVAGGDKWKQQIEKIKGDLATGHAKDLEAHKAKVGALTTQLHGLLVDSAAKSAIAAEKGDLDLLMPFVTKRIKVSEAQGSYSVEVVDEAGDPRYSTTTGSPMSIAELVKEMKANPKYGKLFESDAPKGSAPKPGAAAGRVEQRANKSDMTPLDKIRSGLQKRG